MTVIFSTAPEPVVAKPVNEVQEVRKVDDDQNGHLEAPPQAMVVSETEHSPDIVENVEKF